MIKIGKVRENREGITVGRALFDADYAPDKTFKYDLSLSENPLSCSPLVKKAILASLGNLHHYPDKNYGQLKAALADIHKIHAGKIYVGAGVTEIIQNLAKILVKSGSNIVMPESTFPGILFGATIMGGHARRVAMRKNWSIDFATLEQAVNARTKAVFLCNPNNPTGIVESPARILALARRIQVPIIVSEANIEYCGGSLLDGRGLPENIVVMRSFSKAYGLASLRIGYAVAGTSIIDRLVTHTHPFRTSSLAEVAAIAALHDKKHLQKSVALIVKERLYLTRLMEQLGFSCVPSQSNNFVAHVPRKFDSSTVLVEKLRQHDCSVVDCLPFGRLAGQYIRISPRIHSVNAAFIGTLKTLCNQ